MGRLRKWVARLERETRGDTVRIPQADGTVAVFPRDAYRDAFLNAMDRIGAGEDAPSRHPLLEAAANSPDPKWRESYFGDIDFEGVTEPVDELFE